LKKFDDYAIILTHLLNCASIIAEDDRGKNIFILIINNRILLNQVCNDN